MTVNARGVVCALGLMIAVVAAAGTIPLAEGAPAQSAAPAKPTAAPAPLPPPIKAAFTQAYPQAKVTRVIHDTAHGREQYEIESVDQGLALAVHYKPDGSVLLIKQEVAAADVPSAVTAAITTRYPKATLTRSTRATDEKKSTSYEIGLKGAPVSSVQLTPEGKWISPKPGK